MTQDPHNGKDPLMATDIIDSRNHQFPGFGPKAMNNHVTVTGSPRSGKTFLGKLRTIREHDNGTTVLVVDARGEYTSLASRLGGQTIQPGKPGDGMNPLCWTGIAEDLDGTRNGMSTKIIMLALAISALRGEPMAKAPESLIGRTLVSYCRKHIGTEANEMSLDGYCRELELDDQPEGAPRLARALRAFLDNGGREMTAGNLQLQAGCVTTFDLSQVAPGLQPAAAALCVNAAWDFTTANFQPKVLILDDSRWATGENDAGEALDFLIKRARKLRLGVMTIAGDTQAFTNRETREGRIGLSLMRNSAARIAMMEDEDGLEAILKTLALDEEMEAHIRSAQQGEAMALDQLGEPRPVRIEATAQELELMTQA